MSHVNVLLRLSFAPLVASLAIPACSTSSESSSASPSTDAQFCDAVVSFSHRCNGSADAGACHDAELAEFSQGCAQVASVFSVAVKSAYVACGASVPCGIVYAESPIDVLSTNCGEGVARGAISAAQAKLARDYCAVCAGAGGLSPTACEGAFWGLEADAGSLLAGIGIGALPYSDTIVGLVDTTCIPELDAGSQLGCIDPFAACIGATSATAVTTALPAPAACAPASADGG